MTRIDFYLLPEQQSRMEFALRLCNKVFTMGHKVFVCTSDAEQSKLVSDRLWSFHPGSFLANTVIDTDSTNESTNHSPIIISHNICNDSAPLHDNDVLINLTIEIPPHFSRFERHVELIGDSEDIKEKLRENYGFYKKRGYPLNFHKLD